MTNVVRDVLLAVTGRATWTPFVIGSLIFSTLTSAAGEHGDAPPTLSDPKTTYSPYLQDIFPNQVFFGDTHLHTAYSADAGFFLDRPTPDDSFKWARGETVTSSTGVPSKIVRSLDFLVVSDYADFESTLNDMGTYRIPLSLSSAPS